MNRTIQRSLLAAVIAAAFTAGSAMAARDPGTQSPTSPSSTAAQQSYPSSTSSNSAATRSDKQVAAASMGNNTAQEKFSALDINTDGMIDKQEASASKALTSEFSRLDTNKDGKLSLDEFSAAKNLAAIKVDKTTKKSTSGY